MSDDDIDLYEEFEDDLPDPATSSARLAALEAEVLYTEAFLRPDEADTMERTYHDVLGEWLRDHKNKPIPLILALLERLGSMSFIDRYADSETWTARIEGERNELAAQHILTSSAYVDQVGDDDGKGEN